MTRVITTRSEAETVRVARELAAELRAGDVLLLYGDLGAGKTAFVKGLAEGLEIRRDEVSSPTFTLIQEYRGGRLPLFHADLYRLNDTREIEDLGLEEIAVDGVLAIEWAEKLSGDGGANVRLPSPRVEPSRYGNATAIRIEHGDGDTRTITIVTNPSAHR